MGVFKIAHTYSLQYFALVLKYEVEGGIYVFFTAPTHWKMLHIHNVTDSWHNFVDLISLSIIRFFIHYLSDVKGA